MDIEAALEWLFVHEADPHVDDPLNQEEIGQVIQLMRQFATRTEYSISILLTFSLCFCKGYDQKHG